VNKKTVLCGLLAGVIMLVLSIIGLYGTIWLFPQLAVQYFDPAFDAQSDRYILYFAHPFIVGLALSWFWERFKRVLKGAFFSRGIEFGLAYAVISVFPMMWLIYSAIDVSLALVGSWLLSGIVQGMVAGLVFEKMNA